MQGPTPHSATSSWCVFQLSIMTLWQMGLDTLQDYLHSFRHVFEKRLLSSSCLSFRPSAWNNNAVPKGRILMKLDIWAFFLENLSTKIKSYYNPTKITGILREDVCTFMTISRWITLSIRNVPNKSSRENQNTHFVFSNSFPENRAVYEKTPKNMVKPEESQMTIRHKRVAR